MRLDFTATDSFGGPGECWGSGVEQFLTTRCLPFLRELRLSCNRLPKISTNFINQLHAAQVDFHGSTDVEHILGGVRQLGPFSAPVLFSFNPQSFHSYHGPGIQGIAFVHLHTWSAFQTDRAIRFLPDLQAFRCESVFGTLGADVADGTAYTKGRSLEILGAGSAGEDFVDSGFVDFLNSRRARS